MTSQRSNGSAARLGCSRPALLAQRGVTLVELMISMLLGLIITAGVIQVFAGNRASYAFNEGLSWIQENGRWAVDHISNNVRMAGHMGCLGNVAVFNHLAGAANPLRDDLANGVQGFEANGTNPGQTYIAGAANPAPSGVANSWTPSLPADLVVPARVVPGSDVLVVRYVGGVSEPLVAPFSVPLELSVADPSGFLNGQILVVTDCQKASIFQLSSNPLNAATLGKLRHGAGGGRIPNNAVPAGWPPQESYGLGSEVSTMETVVYYVGEGDNDSAGGNGVPSLFALRLTRATALLSELQPFELIEGVDTMQVRYGVDADNDQQVDNWQAASTVAAGNLWPQVLSVEVGLLMRSSEEYGGTEDDTVYNVAGMQFDPSDDRRFRQVFGTTVGLRNRLP